MAEGKICTKCRTYKNFYDFHKDKKNPSGFNSQCIQCRRPLRQLHYQNNKEKYKEAYEHFINRNPNYRYEYYLKKYYN